MKLRKRNVRKLIAALESGEYRKGKYGLVNKTGTNFCCLGVLCDIRGATWETTEYGELSPFKGNKHNNDPGMIEADSPFNIGLSDDELNMLARINDAHKTFKPVIEYLKEEVLPRAE